MGEAVSHDVFLKLDLVQTEFNLAMVRTNIGVWLTLVSNCLHE